MKAKHIIVILVLAAISITSCQQAKSEHQSEPEHQPESISELMDSVLNRGELIYHYIHCNGDSSYQDNYWFDIDFSNFSDKKHKDIQLYLADKMPRLLDSICRKSEESYRYCTRDSLDYNIIISKNPHEDITYKQYRCWRRYLPREVFNLNHTIINKTKASSNGSDPAPIHETLQKFLAEQKKVDKYDVCYEFDEGFPFSSLKDFRKDIPHGPDSLAASKLTGTHYIIRVNSKNEKDSLHAELTKRIEKLLTKRPIPGTLFRSIIWSPQEPYLMQNVHVCDYTKKKSIYRIEIEKLTKDLHIMELDYNNSPRAAFPYNWHYILRTHNADIISRIPE